MNLNFSTCSWVVDYNAVVFCMCVDVSLTCDFLFAYNNQCTYKCSQYICMYVWLRVTEYDAPVPAIHKSSSLRLTAFAIDKRQSASRQTAAVTAKQNK